MHLLKPTYAIITNNFKVNQMFDFLKFCNKYCLNSTYRLAGHVTFDCQNNLEINENFALELKNIISFNQTIDVIKHKHYIENNANYNNNITYLCTQHYKISNSPNTRLLELFYTIEMR